MSAACPGPVPPKIRIARPARRSWLRSLTLRRRRSMRRPPPRRRSTHRRSAGRRPEFRRRATWGGSRAGCPSSQSNTCVVRAASTVEGGEGRARSAQSRARAAGAHARLEGLHRAVVLAVVLRLGREVLFRVVAVARLGARAVHAVQVHEQERVRVGADVALAVDALVEADLAHLRLAREHRFVEPVVLAPPASLRGRKGSGVRARHAKGRQGTAPRRGAASDLRQD